MSSSSFSPVKGDSLYETIRTIQKQWTKHPRLGYANLPKDEPVRFKHAPKMHFPSSLIDTYVAPTEDAPAELVLNFHGAMGCNGPLNLNYTEFAQERERFHGDTTLRGFLDIFNHRMISFLGRAWADANLAVDMDRPSDSHFLRYFSNLAGLSEAGKSNSSTLPLNAHLYYVGWLSNDVRSPEGLEKILSDFFAVPTEIHPFQGRFIEIPKENCTSLGGPQDSCALGHSVFLGESFWDCTMSFRIRIGPITGGESQRFLPSQKAFTQLCDWVRVYFGEEFAWDVSILIKPDGIEPARLGGGIALGHNTWVFASHHLVDAQEVIFDPEQLSESLNQSRKKFTNV